eukprot:PhF_6_TR4192/c0_g1_i1/m.5637
MIPIARIFFVLVLHVHVSIAAVGDAKFLLGIGVAGYQGDGLTVSTSGSSISYWWGAGIAFNTLNNDMYYLETSSKVVRKVKYLHGVVSVAAGVLNTDAYVDSSDPLTAKFTIPYNLWFKIINSAEVYMFIAENSYRFSSKCGVRILALQSSIFAVGSVSTYVGSSASPVCGNTVNVVRGSAVLIPWDVTTRRQVLYITEEDNSRLTRVPFSTSIVSAFITGVSFTGVTIYKGRIYLTSLATNKLYYSPIASGIATVFKGSTAGHSNTYGSEQFNTPAGINADCVRQSLFVTESYNGELVREIKF